MTRKKEKNNFYLTTTLPYTNANPHIGFAFEAVRADVTARYSRALGQKVFFNTGTDEHGLKIYRRAIEAGRAPQEYVNEYAQKFKSLKKTLNLSWDNFVRTTAPSHKSAARKFWKLCKANDDIYKKNYRIKYCVGCELEKTDSDLEKGRCTTHPNLEIEIVEEENYFFRFSKYRRALLELYKLRPDFVVPDFRFNEIKKFVEDGLEDFSVSRLKKKVPWGVPVPDDEEHVMYVWFDALVGYISAIGWPKNMKKFKTWWPVTQFAGKDQVRQQAAMWQAMLMSAGLPSSKQIVIHGFITSGGQKISKSLGNVIDPFDLAARYGADAVRYFLTRHVNPFEDSDFTEEKFRDAYNANLVNGLGNFVARVMRMAELNPEARCKNSKTRPENRKLNVVLKEEEKNYHRSLEEYRFNEAIDVPWRLIQTGDKLISDERPWEVGKPKVIEDLVLLLSRVTGLLSPFMHETSEKIIAAVRTNKMPAPLFARK